MSERKARGVGLATVSETGQTLDVWYPRPYLGDQPNESDAQLIEKLSQIEGRDDGRGVNRTATVVSIWTNLPAPPPMPTCVYIYFPTAW